MSRTLVFPSFRTPGVEFSRPQLAIHEREFADPWSETSKSCQARSIGETVGLGAAAYVPISL